MNSLNSRIKAIWENSCITKTAFSKKINISQSMASKIISGAATPSDRTISDICREFGVSRAWLVDGVGEMYEKRSLNQTLLEMSNALMRESDDAFRKRFVLALLQSPPEWWATTEAFIKTLSGSSEEPRGD